MWLLIMKSGFRPLTGGLHTLSAFLDLHVFPEDSQAKRKAMGVAVA